MLRFSKRLEIVVGRLGVIQAERGYYVYVGSALGSGGLAARVGRHCRREKRLRWHVDYLRARRRSKRYGTRPERGTGSAGGPAYYARCRGRPCPCWASGRRTAAARRISSSSRCRLPWPIFGRSATRRSNGGVNTTRTCVSFQRWRHERFTPMTVLADVLN